MKDVKLHAGIPVKPVYGPEDLAGRDAERDIGRPGEYPYTRGIHKQMYRDRLWTMRQYVGFGTPAETNARFKYLMAHGQDALNVAFDLPTQLGLDSDDPRADGEVGRVGMAVDTLADMEEAFAGIPLDRVSVSLTINGMAAPITAMYYAVAEKQGAAADRVVTTPQNDILKEFIARGTWIYPVEPSLRLVADLIEFSARHYPRSNPVSVCGYHIREAGCTTAQEMAYGLAIAAAYIELMLARGMAVDEFAPRISFNFTAGARSSRRSPSSAPAGGSTRGCCASASARRIRSRGCSASLIGGGGSAFTDRRSPRTTSCAAPTSRSPARSPARRPWRCPPTTRPTRSRRPRRSSSRCAPCRSAPRRSGAADTADPLGGSYYVEALTNEMEAKILEELAAVERMGGDRRGGEERRHPGRGRAPGLSLRAADGVGRDPQGRRSTATSATSRPRPTARSSCTRSTRGSPRPRSPSWRRCGASGTTARRRAALARADRRGARHRQPDAGDHGGGEGLRDARRDQPGDEGRLRRAQGAREMVSPDRFARGMTFDQYVAYTASPESLARESSPGGAGRAKWSEHLRRIYDATRLTARAAGGLDVAGGPAGGARQGAGDLRGVVVGLPARHPRDREGGGDGRPRAPHLRAGRPALRRRSRARSEGVAERRPHGAVPQPARRQDLPVDPRHRRSTRAT